ncbi:MAG: DUF2783 domain-containing protein [Sphingobium sp.]|jgi:hypothetical protein|nr:DUF2783 domain-containing protein [Sphingobium sp.]MCI1270881.1 DUF2783 domain-containing protein [Sphingobium sp.]MCI1755778.1 DUF2783 domain-containing protein [Sphingobium sp.]MCI2053082.1 DUF2783 domain-containing protein [Sphingobium sp.]
MKLVTSPNLANADGVYEKLIALHHGLDEEESMRVNARLILLLINHIGDADIVSEAIRHAGLGTQQN